MTSPVSMSPRNPIRLRTGFSPRRARFSAATSCSTSSRETPQRSLLTKALKSSGTAAAGKVAFEAAGAVRCRIAARNAGGNDEGGHNRREDCRADGDGGALGSAKVRECSFGARSPVGGHAIRRPSARNSLLPGLWASRRVVPSANRPSPSADVSSGR